MIGSQTKVLEAMACGTPVVSTLAGNYGIGAQDGEHMYVTDDREVFAARVVSLLRGERWKELSVKGRQFVVENYTWDASARRLEKMIEILSAARRTKETNE
jgi:phosphatidylinositol alpha-1,6-mannosyltransferase